MARPNYCEGKLLATNFLYSDILKLYNQDCVLYDTGLYNTVYQVGGAINYQGPQLDKNFIFAWELWIAVAMLCVILYGVHYRGVDSMRWPLYITFPWTILLVLVLLVSGIMIGGDGASEGVREYILGKSDYDKSVWESLQG